MSNAKDWHEILRSWYLARLREQALKEATGLVIRTPAGLIQADRHQLEDFIEARARSSIKHQRYLGPIATARFIMPGWVAILAAALILVPALIMLINYSQPRSVPLTACIFIGSATLLWGYRCASMRLLAIEKVLGKVVKSKGKPRAEESASQLLLELAKLEERQTLIADFSPEATACLGADLKILCASPSAARLWGLSQAELMNCPFEQLVNAECRTSAREAFANARNKPRETSIELSFTITTGDQIDTRCSIEWSPTEEIFFLGCEDISAIKQIERLKEDFYAVISHDLRSPIISVLTMLKLLHEGQYGHVSEIAGSRIRMGIENIELLLNLIGDILEVSNQTNKQLQLNLTDMKILIGEACKTLEFLAEKKGIKIEISGDNFEAVVDKARIRRVFLNLLANAIKFSKRSTEVKITLVDGPDSVCISFSDQGPGLSLDERNSLFKRYWQGSAAKIGAGSGLGLYASKQIVDLHTGSITVESELGKGAIFYVRLPKKQ